MVFPAAKGFRRVVMTAILLSSCHGLNEVFETCLVDSWVACFLALLEMIFFFQKYRGTKGEMQLHVFGCSQ